MNQNADLFNHFEALTFDDVPSHLTLLSKGWLTSGLAPVK